METPSIDVAAELARLQALSLFELKAEWRRLHRTSPPKRLSRELLMRGITYKLQERRLGGLSASTVRRLERRNVEEAGDKRRPVPPIALKAGARLVREWRGATHSVLVCEEGFEWRGRRYGSLTTIAKAITGAHWSGPRFFGLRQPTKRTSAGAESDHAQV